VSKHEAVSQELRIEIVAGAFAPSNKLPSEAQLVERFGVSRPTVARALRDLQAEGLIERRAGSGTFVRSVSPTNTQTRVLGLLVPERGTTEIFEAICGELGALARVHGFGLLWGGSPGAGRRPASCGQPSARTRPRCGRRRPFVAIESKHLADERRGLEMARADTPRGFRMPCASQNGNKNGIREIGLDMHRLNTPGQTPFLTCKAFVATPLDALVR
jgi:DNA-binding MarR family transcriptional regulator